MRAWLIRNRNDRELFWDEDGGWFPVCLSTQEFTDEEKAQHTLPPDGEWLGDY